MDSCSLQSTNSIRQTNFYKWAKKTYQHGLLSQTSKGLEKLFLCTILWKGYFLAHTCDCNWVISCNWISGRGAESMDVKAWKEKDICLRGHPPPQSQSLTLTVSKSQADVNAWPRMPFAALPTDWTNCILLCSFYIIDLSCLPFNVLFFCNPLHPWVCFVPIIVHNRHCRHLLFPYQNWMSKTIFFKHVHALLFVHTSRVNLKSQNHSAHPQHSK